MSRDHTQQVSHGKLETLSRSLHNSLPSREDTERICTASQHPSVLAHEIMTMPYTTLCQNGLKTPKVLLEIPGPHQHPVLLARHMLLLATFMQRENLPNTIFILGRHCSYGVYLLPSSLLWAISVELQLMSGDVNA